MSAASVTQEQNGELFVIHTTPCRVRLEKPHQGDYTVKFSDVEVVEEFEITPEILDALNDTVEGPDDDYYAEE